MKIISVIISIAFLCNSPVYSSPVTEDILRVHSSFQKQENKKRMHKIIYAILHYRLKRIKLRSKIKGFLQYAMPLTISVSLAAETVMQEPTYLSFYPAESQVILSKAYGKTIDRSDGKFYNKDNIIAISQEVLNIILEGGREFLDEFFYVNDYGLTIGFKDSVLTSTIRDAEERINITGISQDPRQVSLVKNIIILLLKDTILNPAYFEGFNLWLKKAKKLLQLADDIFYIECSRANTIAISIELENRDRWDEGRPGGEYIDETLYPGQILIYNPNNRLEAKELYQSLSTGYLELFNDKKLKELKRRGDAVFLKRIKREFLKRIGIIAVDGLKKDIGTNVSEDKMFNYVTKDVLKHEAQHFINAVLEIPPKFGSRETYPVLYTIATGDLPHKHIVYLFKFALIMEKGFKTKRLWRTRILNALAKAANLSVNFDMYDLGQLEKSFAALMGRSKSELNSAALEVLNTLRGNPDSKDRRILDEIDIVRMSTPEELITKTIQKFATKQDILISRIRILTEKMNKATKLKSIRNYGKQISELRRRVIELENPRLKTAQIMFTVLENPLSQPLNGMRNLRTCP